MTTLEIPINGGNQRRDTSGVYLAHLIEKARDLDIPCISEIDLYGKDDPRDLPAHLMSDAVTEEFENYQLTHRYPAA